MMSKPLTQLVPGGAVLAALALGGSASGEAATPSSGSSSTTATLEASGRGGLPAPSSDAAKASAVRLTTARGGSAGAMHHIHDGWIRDLYLTDHEHYVRHHKRLASVA